MTRDRHSSGDPARRVRPAARKRQIDALEHELQACNHRLAAHTAADARRAALLDVLPCAIFTRGIADSVIGEWNRGAEQLYGWSKAQAIGRESHELLKTAFPETLETIFAELMRTGRWRGELIHTCADGDRIVVESTWALQRDAQGEPLAVLEVNTDITERTRTRRALRNSMQRFRAIFDRAAIGIALIQAETGRIEACNPALSTMLGYSEPELVGQAIETFTYEGDRAESRRILAEWSRGAFDRYRLQKRYVRKDGQVIWARVTVSLLRDEGGRPTNSVSMIEDVTEQVALEHQLEREHETQSRLQQERIHALESADKLKDQFLSILSHELRTPINAILGFTSILDDELVGALTDEQHGYLSKILDGSDALLQLVDDLLDMSRIKAGRFHIDARLICLEEVAGEVVGRMESVAARRGIKIVDALPADLPPLVADEIRLAQIFTNLIGNAIKFSPGGDTVTVRARREGDALRVEVVDNGIGIAKSDMPRLFREFGQLDASSTRRFGGVGLGLSIAKALVEAHGGRIGAESAGPGHGSTFWFTLPLAGPPHEAPLS